jgi:hypothetical protein
VSITLLQASLFLALIVLLVIREIQKDGRP